MEERSGKGFFSFFFYMDIHDDATNIYIYI